MPADNNRLCVSPMKSLKRNGVGGMGVTYRVGQNHRKQVLRISCIKFHFLTFQFVVSWEKISKQLSWGRWCSCSDLVKKWSCWQLNISCHILKTCFPWFCPTLYISSNKLSSTLIFSFISAKNQTCDAALYTSLSIAKQNTTCLFCC